MFLAVSIIAMLAVFGLWKLARTAKLEQENRPIHVRSVLVSIIYAIVCVVFYVQILQLLDMFFGIQGVLSFLYYIMPQLFSSAGFFWIVTLALSLFVTVVYCIVMRLVYWLWLIPASNNPDKPNNPISRFFYNISDLFYYMDVRPFVLRYPAENIKRWIKFMRNAFGFLLVGLGVLIPLYIHFGFDFLSEEFLSGFVKSLFMLAMLSFFILDQVFIMLDGVEPEANKGVETEVIGLRHLGDYSGFISLFEGMFGGDALISYYVNNEESEFASISTGPDSEQLERAKHPELLTAVCNCANNGIALLSKNYIDAVTELINGNDVVVFDSYHGEFALYYLAYVQINLFRRRKALIIVDNEEQVGQVMDQYRQIFKRINKVNHIWRFCDLSTMPTYYDDVDIFVCTEGQLFRDDVRAKYSPFFEKVHDVVIADIYKILCRDNAFMLRFINEMRQEHVQFMFFTDENNSDVRKNLKELFGSPDINMYTNFSDAKGTAVMMWRGESYYKTQNALVENLYYDFGIGYTLALFGGQYGVPEINIYGDSSIPLTSYESIVNDSGRELLASVFNTTESIRIDSFVKINPVSAFYRRDLAFDIFYDNCNNLINTVRLALSDSAVLSSLVHIISRPYMLRDYFAHNINRLTYNTTAMQKLVPTCMSELSAPSVALLIKLREQGMNCEQIIGYMNSFGVISNNVEEILLGALNNAFGEDNDTTAVYSAFSFGKKKTAVFENGSYRYTRNVTLTNEDIYLRARMISEENARVVGELNEILPISRSNVYNYYLPGQVWAFNSRLYMITDINDGEIKVKLEETLERELSYTDCYDIEIREADDAPYKVWSDDNVTCEMYRADVKRTITGYLSQINGPDFGYEENNTDLHELREPIIENKRVSVMSLNIACKFDDRYNRSAALFTVLFRGLLETVLPYNHRDILVATKVGESEFNLIDFYSEEEEGIRRDPIPSDWLRDDNYELPLSKMILQLFPKLEGDLIEANTEDEIHLYLIEYSEMDCSALETIMEDIERLLSVLRSFMEWFVTHPELPHAYLKLGYKRVPGIFDTATVHACLQMIAVETNVIDKRLKGRLNIADPANAERCSFCGRLLKVTKWLFRDNRYMCEDCYKNRATERKEIEELLGKAYLTIEELYGVQVPKGIKIKFKSADTIRKAYGGSTMTGRILGLYVPKRREVWVERGGPKACVLSTLIHELTHAWQHANLPNMDSIALKYIEGQSVYVEIEALNRLGETLYADYNERCILSQDDVYSDGLKYWTAHLSTELDKNIFHHMLKL